MVLSLLSALQMAVAQFHLDGLRVPHVSVPWVLCILITSAYLSSLKRNVHGGLDYFIHSDGSDTSAVLKEQYI